MYSIECSNCNMKSVVDTEFSEPPEYCPCCGESLTYDDMHEIEED